MITLKFIYDLGIGLTHVLLKFIALFNTKIKLGVKGRNDTFKILKQNLDNNTKTLWFHCASLGEYEQGLPVFEKLRVHYIEHTIVLSFFSPSGYEIRKNTSVADIVVYLPLDTAKKAKQFIDIVNPELTIFVKYDVWPNYLDVLQKKNLRAILISAAFRKNQIYFKPYGKIFKNALLSFEHIFVQNDPSKALLESIGYANVTVAGDTRFDRVSNQLLSDNTLDFVAKFKGDNLCVVVGSSWPEDEALFINFINSETTKGTKFIIAPHNIISHQIENFISKLNTEVVLFSNRNEHLLKTCDILVIDTIGLLSKIYSYANVAYVGGAMGTTGLHNTLEPAVFGVPVIIGHNHEKFPEAKAFIENGGMFAVKNQKQFNNILAKLLKNKDFRQLAGSKNEALVNKNRGAVIQILDYLRI
ncbi:glycosyltransferase N-terminal domain-containing protein [Flavobacteriaceae bacterium MHTCC 0001]